MAGLKLALMKPGPNSGQESQSPWSSGIDKKHTLDVERNQGQTAGMEGSECCPAMDSSCTEGTPEDFLAEEVKKEEKESFI